MTFADRAQVGFSVAFICMAARLTFKLAFDPGDVEAGVLGDGAFGNNLPIEIDRVVEVAGKHTQG